MSTAPVAAFPRAENFRATALAAPVDRPLKDRSISRSAPPSSNRAEYVARDIPASSGSVKRGRWNSAGHQVVKRYFWSEKKRPKRFVRQYGFSGKSAAVEARSSEAGSPGLIPSASAGELHAGTALPRRRQRSKKIRAPGVCITC